MSYLLASKSWGAEEYQAILGVLSTDYYKMGNLCLQFEEEFAKWTGSKYAVFCNSGSSANLLALAALKCDPRSIEDTRTEILVPSVSWSTTYYPIMQNGYVPVFVDVDSKTFNIDVELLEDKITSNTRAIFAVNLLGNPCNYKKLLELCKKYSLVLIEDNCESMGASYGDKKTGSLGYIGTHSTFFSHHMSTMEGGICTTDDELTYEILKSLRAHGWVRDVTNKELFFSYFDKPKNEFYEFFHFVLPGYNFRPTEVQAAIGLEQLKKLDNFINARIDNANYFSTCLNQKNKNIFLQKEEDDSISSWFGFGLLFESENDRDLTVSKLIASNIECRPIVSGNMLKQPVFNNFSSDGMPSADCIHNNGLMIGNHQFSIKSQIDLLMDIL